MSLKSDVEELIVWLAELIDRPADGQQPAGLLDSATWSLVVGRLSAAGKALTRAAEGLHAAGRPSGSGLAKHEQATNQRLAGVLAEVATDLSRECEDLRRRAMVRRGLAPKEPAESSLALDDAEDSVEDPNEPDVTPPPSARPRVPDADKHGVRLAIGRLMGAQKSLTTATNHLSIGEKDAGATSFAEELDVLTEMVLGLRRRVDEISIASDTSSSAESPAAPASPSGERQSATTSTVRQGETDVRR
ncbi:hypothetical protein NSZ01_08560 [Nocardioides szechwanensis]|uniref:Uncharacterized protein n=1 Tax=Nocardioides szechwanensis TaxID=1005944 RepID=A0A1G9UZ89_9ACTN|nr:hypothetical protein [Nocardioides szechwanensis]GEP33088.1 hypothetical protein NSZ01_08560 [Nocardioides szechwanensis]SDM65292.1 hypothetical protein SAMN05192576_0602 [Nocardioides szechwanensis]